ncbi:MAG: hypothetical protein ABI318_17320 [Chthoniobacteraceae bacterium]
MAGWLNDIGSKLGSFIGKRPGSAHVGAFGKHPGWNDHLDDIGLETEPLIAAKQYLYVQGIGGVIDAGQWEALPPGDALAEFRHTFVWLDERETLVGKLWSSSDGKGRTKYPMIVCADFSNRTAPGVPDATPLLDQFEQSCRGTTSPDDVRNLAAQARSAAAQLIEAPAPPAASREEFARTLGIEPGSDNAARIAYAVESHFAGLDATGVGKARINLKLGQFKGQPQHIRLPADPAQPLASQLFWREFTADRIPAGAPQFYAAAAAAPWLDIIVGLPTARHLFCLRAGEKALPAAHQIPFNLPDVAKASAAARWQRFFAEG